MEIKKKASQRRLFFLLLLSVASILSLAALVLPQLAPLSAPALQAGQVAQQDFLASENITYESAILTEQQRQAAERAVANVYTATDTSVARRQLERLRATLAFITSQRADAYASQEQQLADLANLEDIHLDKDTAAAILALSDTRWQAVQQEAIIVLEEVMRSTIRDDRLDDTRRSVPTFVSLALPEDQANIAAGLAAAFIAPNSFYSEELTQAAREKARQAVEPVKLSFVKGETVASRGRVLTEKDLEALQNLGLAQVEFRWGDLVSALGLVFLGITFTLFYLRRSTRLLQDPRGLTLITLLFLVFLTLARWVVSGQTLLPYIFPLAAYGLTVAALFGAEAALVTSLPLAILAGYNLPNSLELTLYFVMSSFFGILALGRAQRVIAFFWAGAVTVSAGALVTLVYRINAAPVNWLEITTLTGAAMLSGIASAGLSLLLQFFLAQFLGATTALQLMEISRPDHPLLQLILRKAPGTYQHCLQVANLAEQAAEAIGADTLLTRVGALYHDAGKALNPALFIENQLPGSANPHDSLDPVTSAQIIIRHVDDGLELARSHRLPGRILDFIAEHHGSMLARYQYINAVKANGGDESRVDKEQFRYHGPRPRSRETAILMLADGCEARVRAERPKDEQQLEEMLRSMIQHRLESGQLNETALTLRDLDLIVQSFTTTLRGFYHPRIEYPQLEKGRGMAEHTPDSALTASPTVPAPRPTVVAPSGLPGEKPT